MADEKKVGVPQAAHRRQSLEASVIRACSNCGAPGVYKNEPSIQAGWPGCYVEANDPRVNQPVGDTCPNCHESGTVQTEPLGEIWSREF